MKTLIYLLLSLCFSYGYTDSLDKEIHPYIQQLYKEHTIKPGFDSLSPALTNAIAKSFFLLRKCYPERLNQGCYVEFGIYKGYSLWFAQQVGKYWSTPSFQYFGFDSFEGLPAISEDYKRGDWSPGLYGASLDSVSVNLKDHGADFNTLHLIKGWFSRSLFLENYSPFNNLTVSIVTIDSDTYESCREIMDFWFPLLEPGTIILFDDFLVDTDAHNNQYSERKALIEWCTNHSEFLLKPLFPFSWHGYAFMVIGSGVKRIPPEMLKRVSQLIDNPQMPRHFSLPNIIEH